ncbi:unnamed protein product [Moneuplotes crassus]|uniref:PA14 domain-containing protein n=1 Tax=Euplotes crassus TaxID=5936 RepID=A0AAD1UEX6_EUPCR|nr:unnamed protein product [Moneuplotes crassus]
MLPFQCFKWLLSLSCINIITVNSYSRNSRSYQYNGVSEASYRFSDINFYFAAGDNITPGHVDAAARFSGKLTAFKTGAYTLSLVQDNGSTLRINGVALINKFRLDWYGTDYVTYNFNAFETYEVQIDWVDFSGPGGIKLGWDSGSGDMFIPPENYAVANDIGSSPLQISVSCPEGYEQVSSTTDQCRSICGDGLLVGPEVCDDNNTADGDGCKSDCTAVETRWVCSGGSATTQSICKECTQGFYQNSPSHPTTCVTECGDGYKVGAEVCDDGNTSDADGCKSDCTEIEENYVCFGGSPNNKDTCELCAPGFTPDANKETCIPVCGDGILADSEACDDGNTIEGDGCAPSCDAIEVGWSCEQNNPTICKRDYKSVLFTDEEKAIQGSTFSFIVILVGFSIICRSINQPGGNSALSFMNQIQLLILFVLLEIHLPLRVINFLRSLSVILVNLNISWSFFIAFREIIDWFDFPQNRADFEMININSGSTLLNLNTLISLIIVFMIFHLSVAIFVNCNKESEKCWARLAKYIKKCFTFKVYFVLIFETFIIMCLCSFSEIDAFTTDGSGSQKRSFAFSVICLVIILAIQLLVISVWVCATISPSDSNRMLFIELFDGLKTSKLARLQPLLFLLRRAILCLMIASKRACSSFSNERCQQASTTDLILNYKYLTLRNCLSHQTIPKGIR